MAVQVVVVGEAESNDVHIRRQVTGGIGAECESVAAAHEVVGLVGVTHFGYVTESHSASRTAVTLAAVNKVHASSVKAIVV